MVRKGKLGPTTVRKAREDASRASQASTQQASAQQASAQATSQPASAPPNTNSTGTVTTTPPYSSEGPTLPIIGAPFTTDMPDSAPTPAPSEDGSTRNPKKRKMDSSAAGAFNTSASPATPANLKPLYEPWLLLPASLRTSIGARITSFGPNIVPIVVTKNKNTSSGINQLKWWLFDRCADCEKELEMRDRMVALHTGKAALAVSAPANGANNLITIVELTKRILGGDGMGRDKDAMADDGGGADGDDAVQWYMYNQLGSQMLERAQPKAKKRAITGDAEEDDDEFESLAEIKEKDRVSQKAATPRRVPFLTVWISKTRIPELRDVFGEQTFEVKGELAGEESQERREQIRGRRSVLAGSR